MTYFYNGEHPEGHCGTIVDNAMNELCFLIFITATDKLCFCSDEDGSPLPEEDYLKYVTFMQGVEIWPGRIWESGARVEED